jgi:GT2 family glycosyltransferase
MVVRRAAAQAIRGFDDTLETTEDFDFCNRLRLCGYRILSDAALHSTHFGDPQTLDDLFKSELWRGRDTLRVGLRRITSWEELPSMIFPVVTLTAIGAAALSAALAVLDRDHLRWTAISLAIVLALSWLRAMRMLLRDQRRPMRAFPALWTVAAVYDIARALALVIRMPHRGSTPTAKRSQVVA